MRLEGKGGQNNAGEVEGAVSVYTEFCSLSYSGGISAGVRWGTVRSVQRRLQRRHRNTPVRWPSDAGGWDRHKLAIPQRHKAADGQAAPKASKVGAESAATALERACGEAQQEYRLVVQEMKALEPERG
jgi:hypothetical protein